MTKSVFDALPLDLFEKVDISITYGSIPNIGLWGKLRAEGFTTERVNLLVVSLGYIGGEFPPKDFYYEGIAWTGEDEGYYQGKGNNDRVINRFAVRGGPCSGPEMMHHALGVLSTDALLENAIEPAELFVALQSIFKNEPKIHPEHFFKEE